ncbi:Lipoate-protein ligase A [Diplonema papillatum]|nr:Lipoate-protein ligase A [Diplonema papillatum]
MTGKNVLRGAVVQSLLRCPFANLSIEEHYLRRLERRKGVRDTPVRDEVALVHYYNDPCIVVGRYQNQYLECNVTRATEQGVTIARRRSGGGTVYHDSGCFCFSIVTPRALYDPKRSVQVVRTALLNLGVPDVRAGSRHDLWIGDDKITGSAFRLTNDSSFHHGTILLTTQLDKLNGILRPHPKSVEFTKGRSVPSVRSPVTNVISRAPGFRAELLPAALSEAFFEEYGVPAGPGARQHVRIESVSDLGSDVADMVEEHKALAAGGTPAFTRRFAASTDLLEFAMTVAVERGVVGGVPELFCRLKGGAGGAGVRLADYEEAIGEKMRGSSFSLDDLRNAVLLAALSSADVDSDTLQRVSRAIADDLSGSM